MDLVINDAFGFNEYVAWVQAKEPFALSRFGDGEWYSILGRTGKTCDGQTYTFSLQRDLSRILMDAPSYHLGLQPLAVRQLSAEIGQWLLDRGLNPAWVNSDVWHRASIHQRFSPMLDALRTRQLVIVGPAHLQGLANILPIVQFVEVPDQNAHEALPTVRYQLAKSLARMAKRTDDAVVALCAGPASNVLIHDYCGHTPTASSPVRTTWIDFGSVFEPYVGLSIRRYHAEIVERLQADGICPRKKGTS